MYTFATITALSKQEFYRELIQQAQSLLHGEQDIIANMANLSSLLFYSLPDINWAGFYLFKDKELVLGPFQGKPACIRIPIGKGVCGTAALHQETILVRDVELFPGHIACDAASRSEIVVPILKDGHLCGVLDIDSPLMGRFDDDDRNGLETLIAHFVAGTDFSG